MRQQLECHMQRLLHRLQTITPNGCFVHKIANLLTMLAWGLEIDVSDDKALKILNKVESDCRKYKIIE